MIKVGFSTWKSLKLSVNVHSLAVGRNIQGIINNSALSKAIHSYPETSRPEGMHIEACEMASYLIERRRKIERRTRIESAMYMLGVVFTEGSTHEPQRRTRYKL